MCVFQAALDCLRRKLSGCILYLFLGTGIQDLICSLCVPSLQFGLVYKIATSIPLPPPPQHNILTLNIASHFLIFSCSLFVCFFQKVLNTEADFLNVIGTKV
jgi:hypothetical protein